MTYTPSSNPQDGGLPNLFRIYIERGFKEEIDKIVSEEAKEASARVEKRVRETMPKVAMSIFDNWTATWENQTTLAIRVEFKEPKSA
jgi:hypothetical protein